MGCCASFIKYLLFGLNILFWLAGAAILGVGIWLKVDPNVASIFSAAGVSLQAGATALIVIGCIIFAIGFCGCCGAIKENKCLLGTYFVFVLLIFIAQVTISIWAYVSSSSIENTIQKALNSTVPLVPGTSEAEAAKVIQSTFECCGYVYGCQDWQSNNASGCGCDSSKITDSSKCAAPGASGTCTNADQSGGGGTIYQQECYTAIVNFIKQNIGIIAGVAIGIAVGELFLLIATIVVCNTAGKRGYETA